MVDPKWFNIKIPKIALKNWLVFSRDTQSCPCLKVNNHYLQLFLQFNPLLNGLSLSALSSANLFACLLWG